MLNHGKRLVELVVVYLAAPAAIFFLPAFPVLPVLWVFAFLCFMVLKRDAGFKRSNLWRASAVAEHWRFILGRFVLSAVSLSAAICLLAPDLLFSLIRQKPLLWGLIIILYPILSVYPQELIYRTYFFHRYRDVFPLKWVLILVNALLFGYMHIVFHNWIAVILTLISGVFFAATYHRSRSTLVVALEHALYGGLIFTSGLGQFFYMGTLATVSQGVKF